jgi:hypothetical protein
MYSKVSKLNKIVSASWHYGILSIALLTLLCSASIGASAQASPVSAAPGRPSNQTQNSRVQSQLRNSVVSGSNASTSPVYYYNWSGYAASAAKPFNAVETTFTQPAVTCTVPGAWTLFWVGFDGFNNGTVEQAGTAAQCDTSSNPKPVYYAWWEMWPTNTIQTMPLSIKPGDTITANVTYNASNASYSMLVNNKTTRQTYTKAATCASNLTCARQTAEWIVERPTLNGAYTPLANWHIMNLISNTASNTTRRNKPVYQPVSAYANTPIYMINTQYTTTMATVSTLNTKSNLFSDTWLAAQ